MALKSDSASSSLVLKSRFVSALFVLGFLCCTPTSFAVAENPVAPRPTLVPVPSSVLGVGNPIAPLTEWITKASPQGEFWSVGTDISTWTAVVRGARGARGGGRGAGEAERGEFTSAYRIKIAPPADWSGKRIIIRFDGAADGAKLWVNGNVVRDHWGSLMAWSADITDFLKPGEDASITLGVDERGEGLNGFVRGGGMQRDAYLIALPADYLARFHVETTFDRQYKNATLHVWLAMSFNGEVDRAGPAKVKLTLKDPAGKELALDSSVVELPRSTPNQVFDVPVIAPQKWDAEHPNLYTISASVLDPSGAPAQTVSKRIGIRQIEVRGNQMFVNGNEIKLRGIWGGNGVQQLKDLNANHTRQKWVTEQFLDDADRLGLYVLDENPIDFAKYGAESDPKYGYQWLGFTADLAERDRDHPSVIMWGLGNESFDGRNVLKAFKYIQAEDTQRPAMFSFPNRVPMDQELPYSIYSSHYPNLMDPNMSLGDYIVAKWHSPSLTKARNPLPAIPVLHDEYSHVVLNQAILNRDPNVRNFWGNSIHEYWERMMATQGALGGDIFGLNGFGSGHTENYLTRKSYSPVRIVDGPVPNPGDGKPLPLAIRNWFDHTNLSELKITWKVGEETGAIPGPDVAPHAAGSFDIPARAWKDGEQLNLKFSLADGTPIDEFALPVNPPAAKLPTPQGPAPTLEQNEEQIIITGEHFKIAFNKRKGLISNASYDGKTVLVDGPFLDILGSGLAYGEWWCDKIAASIDGDEAVVNVVGNYAVFGASFQVRVDGQGPMTTKYTADFIPGEPPPPTYSPWDATSVGGYSEVGVSYMLPASTTSLAWRRKALWSVYPNDHPGRPQGTASKTTDDFRSTKENIYEAAATVGDGGPVVTALSDGRDSVRLSVDNGYRALPGGIRMGIHNEWNYPDIGLGNLTRPPIRIKSGYSNTVYLKLGAQQP